VPIEIDHQLRHARLGRGDATRVLGQVKLAQERGLETVAVQILALDAGGHQGLIADQIDGQRPLLAVVQMPEGAEQEPRLVQETRLQRQKPRTVVDEIGPVGLLPVPGHDA
jgi:hypothetical protein